METLKSASKAECSHYEKYEYWKAHIERLRSSNLSKAKYCRLNNLDYRRFDYWFKRIKVKEATVPSLIPVQVKAPSSTGLCSIQLKDGRVLNINSIEALSLILDRMG